MAKKWTPSRRQLEMFDELLKRQNQTRKLILKRRKIIEEEGVGRPLPDLIIPQKAHRRRNLNYSFNSYQEYREAMRRLSELYGKSGSPLKEYYKQAYKQNILNILDDWIKNVVNFDEEPENPFREGQNNHYYYSEEQIAKVGEDAGKLLTLYNYLKKLNINDFMALYDSGAFPSLHVIYDDVTGKGNFSEVDYFISDFKKTMREIRKENVFYKLREVGQIEGRKDFVDNYGESVKNRTPERLAEIKSGKSRQ